MRRLLAAASVMFAMLLVLPAVALAGQAPRDTVRSVTGDIVYVSPAAFAVDTGSKIETFRIAPGSDLASHLVPTERVEVAWTMVPETGERAVVHIAEKPARWATMSTEPEGTVTGHVAFLSPMSLGVESANGVDVFLFDKASVRPSDVGPGDDVQVKYRIEPETGRRVVAEVRATSPRGDDHAMKDMGTVAHHRGMVKAKADLASCNTVEGRIALVTPDRLYLEANGRLDEFMLNDPSRLADVAPGDAVRVWVEPAADASAPGTVVQCRPMSSMQTASR